MVDLIEKIGPYLGIAAFLGLSVLAFLIFQQAREIRRLREWAGRAPERSEEAADAMAAAAEARAEAAAAESEEVAAAEEEPEVERGPVGTRLAGVREWFADLYDEADRRSPIDPRYFLALFVALIVAAGVLTSGFGLVGGGDAGGGGGGGKGRGQEKEKKKVEVAVLNATQEETVGGGEVAGVPDLANVVADEVVKPAGYKAGAETNAPEGEEDTVVMFEPDEDGAANDLAAAISDQLGEPEIVEMTDDVRDVSKGASLALLVGLDNADFGESGNSG